MTYTDVPLDRVVSRILSDFVILAKEAIRPLAVDPDAVQPLRETLEHALVDPVILCRYLEHLACLPLPDTFAVRAPFPKEVIAAVFAQGLGALTRQELGRLALSSSQLLQLHSLLCTDVTDYWREVSTRRNEAAVVVDLLLAKMRPTFEANYQREERSAARKASPLPSPRDN